ncbi:Nif3-like dinuclear metal center hexameric protein [Paenibacillus radicis (ex Xue et al. 2023)]|uniref:GTP cyclohydrolase 1 type 2 homolog n=1 Tax=Paenibacillus radicis (ex Xue et al. 2023) TaxID=2972489 RepID=A0ABT1YAH9_9BACL|nr:Nif3-like dinuclear metal center hexameric protein [Paenibacillus radicis (ex Xue et al. 2023)]MCR8630203.1 Nif3-like dinuclear metal center hexameric protein [Paenibacillus radicis (ex Xue et al. 2023)]
MIITVQMVLNRLIEPVGPLETTVDTLKSGRLNAEVRKVAVVFMTTYAAIKQAVDSGVDLIITHEPTYYNHKDEVEWLAGDPVYERKRMLIEESGISIFRLHDYVHKYKPDGILIGMLKKLEWEAYADPERLNLLTVPHDEQHTVRTIVTHLKEKLNIDSMLVAGDPEMSVRCFGLMPGASGGRSHIKYFENGNIDLLIVGETNEWETNEYVRDAMDMGLQKALIITGHQNSEEAGMLTVVEMVREAFPELQVDFIASLLAVKRI